MTTPITTKKYTKEEYLELEEQSTSKNEYANGEIIAMAGGTTNHNKIALNFCRQFPLNIDNKDYELYLGDVRLWIPQYCIYTYPDIMVILDQPVYEGDNQTTVTNPLLIVEILSNSTKNYDRTDKFKYYRSIPTFQEYILVDQYSYAVEQYSKQSSDTWLFKEYNNQEQVLVCASVDFKILLKDIYSKINL